ncbi:MAG: division/cell wall cluster transcriptional repressor MraZ [Gammaproteobacteria bacterium]|nr:division/cell wall cluster transcriptional repressor MraZ [Gammaproteobacteria bacterium]
MFRGFNSASVDNKGRLAVPVRLRERLTAGDVNLLILTLNPWDRCLWLYPLREWELIEDKLKALSDFDKQSRRTKQILRGYATECALDAQGRILIPADLRSFAGISSQVVVSGQGNKCEIWDKDSWAQARDEWLQGNVGADGEAPAALQSLSL